MDANISEPHGLKHKPIFLLPYANYDGSDPNETDCLFLSLGWAQYDPRSASLKAFRHTGSKWSRQSEEVPLHRAVDLVILLARAIRSMAGLHLHTINFPPGTFENQSSGLLIQAGATSLTEDEAFSREITRELVGRRLGKLREVLNELHDTGAI